MCAGYDEVVTIVVLDTPEAVDKKKGAESMLNVDGALILGKNSAVASDLDREQGLSSTPYALADGALMDLSFKGAMGVGVCMRTHALSLSVLQVQVEKERGNQVGLGRKPQEKIEK